MSGEVGSVTFPCPFCGELQTKGIPHTCSRSGWMLRHGEWVKVRPTPEQIESMGLVAGDRLYQRVVHLAEPVDG